MATYGVSQLRQSLTREVAVLIGVLDELFLDQWWDWKWILTKCKVVYLLAFSSQPLCFLVVMESGGFHYIVNGWIYVQF